MDTPAWYCFFPYLRLKSRLPIRGLTLRSTNDVDDLSSDQRSSVETIRAMFRHHDGTPIGDMVFTNLPAAKTAVDEWHLRASVEQAQSVLSYIHTAPSHTGEPILSADHFSSFLFRPDRVILTLALPGRAQERQSIIDGFADGFHGIRDSTVLFSVVKESLIHPAFPYFWRRDEDLAENCEQFFSHLHNWPLRNLFAPGIPNEAQVRAVLLV